MSYLHVLEINPLPVVLLAIIFSLWRKKWQPTPVFLPGESHGERALVGYSLWGCKESDTTKQLTHIFSHSEGFTLFIVSFTVQKLLSLIRPHLFIFVFLSMTRRWIIEDLAVIYECCCGLRVLTGGVFATAPSGKTPTYI